MEISTRTLHTVPLNKLREWRDANGGSPREMSRKYAITRRTAPTVLQVSGLATISLEFPVSFG